MSIELTLGMSESEFLISLIIVDNVVCLSKTPPDALNCLHNLKEINTSDHRLINHTADKMLFYWLKFIRIGHPFYQHIRNPLRHLLITKKEIMSTDL